jgi:CRISPR-associated protein Cas2
MRLILFFDLPVKTKKERKIYANFRKLLISKGYLMMQYSVYVKLFANRDALKNHISFIKKNVPQEGHIRLAAMTEKQYANMEIIIGGRSRQEEVITDEPMILL